MDSSDKMPAQTSLFQVFLRLRPPQMFKQHSEPWLLVEPPLGGTTDDGLGNETPYSTHITLQPPNDSRKRAIERFGFTQIFKQEASQSDIFRETGSAESVKNLVQNSRDGLIATLGVTGSGKSHTILGTKSQRGLTQMTLDVLYSSIGQGTSNSLDLGLTSELQACDPSEAQILPANTFLDMLYGDGDRARASRAQTPMLGHGSRAQTPMVSPIPIPVPGAFPLFLPNDSRLGQPLLSGDIVAHKHLHGHCNSSKRSPKKRCGCAPLGGVNFEAVRGKLTPIKDDSARRSQGKFIIPITSQLHVSFKEGVTKLRNPQESLTHSHHTRRPPMPRPSGFAQLPNVSEHAFEIDAAFEYAVLLSMYEVYNDRIFDLLSNSVAPNGPVMSTRQGTTLQKHLTRRPLLFKNTELSQDRKVVAGLRKIVCGSYEEAMMVLETGLTERRVAGTGSNSVSSRSHGFFCIEVKKRLRHAHGGSRDWKGATLSIVDLAGSERARNAKTTGSTLAEAGKINESLMYLGQCLQVQSDCQQDGSKPIVPFRQCKLTELLFSNSFPSAGHPSATHKQPQRAVMVVTADPEGDFNATSQILRYSALAREVTVPRIPSVASAIVTGLKTPSNLQSGRLTPQDHYFSAQELEQATNEVQRLAEECESLAVRLTQEEIRRTEAELRLQAAEERLANTEQDVREECWQEMELMMDEEKLRWQAAWEEERHHGEEYLDGKIDILEKTSQFRVHDAAPSNSRVEELERENEMLHAKLQALEQEVNIKSPTKPKRIAPGTPAKGLVLSGNSNTNISTNPFLSALKARDSGSALKLKKVKEGANDPFEISPRKLSLRESTLVKTADMESTEETPGTVKRKQRKLTTRKWDFADPDEI